MEAGLTKAEIRELSQRAGLKTWDRPASACLSSRIPYGTPVTIENVKTVDRGEEAIQARSASASSACAFTATWCGSRSRRKNWTGALTPEMARAFTAIFKPLGFHYVTLDLEGYRQGSLNAVLK